MNERTIVSHHNLKQYDNILEVLSKSQVAVEEGKIYHSHLRTPEQILQL